MQGAAGYSMLQFQINRQGDLGSPPDPYFLVHWLKQLWVDIGLNFIAAFPQIRETELAILITLHGHHGGLPGGERNLEFATYPPARRKAYLAVNYSDRWRFLHPLRGRLLLRVSSERGRDDDDGGQRSSDREVSFHIGAILRG